MVQSLKVLNEDFNIVQVRIVLLSLFDAKEKQHISSSYFKKTVLFLENFHFVYNALTSNKSNRFDSIFTTYAIKLRRVNDKIEGHRVLDEFMGKLKAILPKYDVFEKAFLELTYSKSKAIDNIKTKYVLNRINSYYSQKEVFDDQGSIEHIIPEIPGDKDTLKIGNLILLEQNLNGRCANEDYSQKKKIYAESSYTEVKRFVYNNETWTKSDINQRTKELAKLYYDKILKFD